MNIPFAKLEINSGIKPCSAATDVSNSQAKAKTAILPKSKLSKHADDIVLIDLTDEEVTKIVKCKKRRKISWLEEAKRSIDAKIKGSALKRDKNAENASLKMTQHLEDITPSEEIPRPKQPHSPITTLVDVATNGAGPIVSPIKEEQHYSSSSPPVSSTSKLVCYDSDSSPGKADDDEKTASEDDSMTGIPRSNSMTVTSSKALRLEKEDAKISAFCDTDELSKDKQPADSTVSSDDGLKNVSTSSEESVAGVTAMDDSTVVAEMPVVEQHTIIEDTSVNSNAKTDYYLNDKRVQEQSHTNVEKKDDTNVNNEQVKAKPSPAHMNDSQTKESTYGNVNSSTTQSQADSSKEPNSTNNYYDIQNPEIDGLTLLASVSAQHRVSPKKAELKVKPYSSLQQKVKYDSAVVNRIIGICPEDALDKVALQVEVSSTELVSSTVNKHQQYQDPTSPDLLSYILDETIQNNLENNDNANVILNGETVMLLQKSPNSNLYIINKAAVDSAGGSKLNYNSDDEDVGRSAEPEDTKCCQQSGVLIKHEPDDVGPCGRLIKPDPDYADVKSNALVAHEDAKPPGYDIHYSGYPVRAPPGGYRTYSSMHHPSTGCACVSCAYCHQLPYYLPTSHAAQLSVQTNPTVQEKRSGKKTEAAAMLAKVYEDQLLSSRPSDDKQQKTEQGFEDKEVSRLIHVDSKLPLKKRLKVQRLSMDYSNNQKIEAPFKAEAVVPTYPGTLMMSIADVESMPHELGAVVEVASASIKPAKGRVGRREKTTGGTANNQNVPNCFPRKGSCKKKRPDSSDELVENSGVSAPKKSRKSSGAGVKQTRSSRRAVPTVNYVYPEIDAECNPSGKRKKKRSNR